MFASAYFFIILLFAPPAFPTPARGTSKPTLSPEILTAKSIYFQDKTGVPAVGKKALDQLKKWGRFRIVREPERADLILLLSADPYKGGWIIYSGGETGTIDDHGNVQEDPIPQYNVAGPTRYAYLTVVDPKTGKSLWNKSARWGGLLTGFNSAGERLVKELERQVRNRAQRKVTP